MQEPSCPTASEWAATRGDKWCAQLVGMESMLSPLDEPLIRALQLEGSCAIAEIGCGGGATAMEVLRRAPAGSVVHGFDISESLIERARSRVPAESHAIAFSVADMATAAPARPYARLLSRLGVMFFDHPQAAFTNLARWLEPGGRFAFAVWGPPAENPWMTSVRDVVSGIIALPDPDPASPGPFRYAASEKLVALLGRAGFAHIEVRDWRGTLAIGGGKPPAEAAAFALASFASFSDLLAKEGERAEGEARRALTTCFSDHQAEGSVAMGACVRIVTGERA